MRLQVVRSCNNDKSLDWSLARLPFALLAPHRRRVRLARLAGDDVTAGERVLSVLAVDPAVEDAVMLDLCHV